MVQFIRPISNIRTFRHSVLVNFYSQLDTVQNHLRRVLMRNYLNQLVFWQVCGGLFCQFKTIQPTVGGTIPQGGDPQQCMRGKSQPRACKQSPRVVSLHLTGCEAFTPSPDFEAVTDSSLELQDKKDCLPEVAFLLDIFSQQQKRKQNSGLLYFAKY